MARAAFWSISAPRHVTLGPAAPLAVCRNAGQSCDRNLGGRERRDTAGSKHLFQIPQARGQGFVAVTRHEAGEGGEVGHYGLGGIWAQSREDIGDCGGWLPQGRHEDRDRGIDGGVREHCGECTVEVQGAGLGAQQKRVIGGRLPGEGLQRLERRC